MLKLNKYLGKGITILDVCCGSRMFYYDKHSCKVLYCDNRWASTTLCDGREFAVNPDYIINFLDIPFAKSTFKTVVFDPPHLRSAGGKSWLAQKYGVLPKNWQAFIKKAFAECFRVLKKDGVLIFKWSEDQIPCKDVIPLALPYKPLLGDRRGKRRFIIFVK